MKYKKVVTLALATALTASIFTPAFANTGDVQVEPTVIMQADAQEEKTVYTATTLGTVQKVTANSILVKNEQTEIQFHIGEDAWLVDGQLGIPVALEELQGKEVVVTHDANVKETFPEQSTAYAVIVKGDVLPNYAVIEEADFNSDGTVRLTTNYGGMWVTVAKNADIKPFRTKNIVTAQDLQKGAKVILYYDMVALSYPGQAATNRVVLLEPAEEPSGAVIEQTTVMVGLRDAAKALGLTVDWRQEGQTVILSKGAFNATVNIGSDKYGISKMLLQLDQAAELRDGRTYVPQSFVDALKEALQ